MMKIPTLTSYGGEGGDPRDHVDQFIASMDLISPNDALLCKMFRTTLTGRAQTWFSHLTPGSIACFDQLARGFMHHFAGNKRFPKTPSYLFTIIQEEGESLKTYMQRFANEVLDVPHVNPELFSGIVA